MKRLPVFWHIFLATLLLLACTFTITALYLSHTLKSFYYTEVEDDLKARALLIEDTIRRMVASGDIKTLRSFCRNSGRRASTRITVIDMKGVVLADSNEDPEVMELHNTRPEFIKALAGTTGSSVRYSHTLHQDMLYVAIPLKDEVKSPDTEAPEIGAMRVSIPLAVTQETLWTIEGRYAVAGVVILLAAALGGLFLSSRLSRPLERMKETAEKIARGDMKHMPEIDSSPMVSEEVASLSKAMNTMALQIKERINTIDHQKNELEMVFCALKEAVIVLDNHHRILRLNRAAAELFAVSKDGSAGRSFREVARDLELNRTLEQVTSAQEPAEIEISCMTHAGQRFLNARFAILRDRDSGSAGILIVISDLTEMRRLENIRKEFVANVSHELKTPVTSIRGYAEVLLEGALDSRDDAIHFLGIIVKQSERLQAIVEDLLALSRIEQDAKKGNIKLEPVNVRDVIASVMDMCEIRARDKDINIEYAVEDQKITANAALLVQAVSNLVINAIKYSDNNSTVHIKAYMDKRGTDGEELVIRVEDTGIGIGPEHLPRIFERFYRSDKARSRKLGGTGLGLAIVKHIARVHGGRAEVQSTIGKGSVFSIHIPRRIPGSAGSETACGLA